MLRDMLIVAATPGATWLAYQAIQRTVEWVWSKVV